LRLELAQSLLVALRVLLVRSAHLELLALLLKSSARAAIIAQLVLVSQLRARLEHTRLRKKRLLALLARSAQMVTSVLPVLPTSRSIRARLVSSALLELALVTTTVAQLERTRPIQGCRV